MNLIIKHLKMFYFIKNICNLIFYTDKDWEIRFLSLSNKFIVIRVQQPTIYIVERHLRWRSRATCSFCLSSRGILSKRSHKVLDLHLLLLRCTQPLSRVCPALISTCVCAQTTCSTYVVYWGNPIRSTCWWARSADLALLNIGQYPETTWGWNQATYDFLRHIFRACSQ